MHTPSSPPSSSEYRSRGSSGSFTGIRSSNADLKVQHKPNKLNIRSTTVDTGLKFTPSKLCQRVHSALYAHVLSTVIHTPKLRVLGLEQCIVFDGTLLQLHRDAGRIEVNDVADAPGYSRGDIKVSDAREGGGGGMYCAQKQRAKTF